MKYFKKANGDVFAFEDDGSQDDLITSEFLAMTPEEVDAHLHPAPIATIPQSVSPRQFRRALTQLGLRDQIEVAVAQSDQDTKDDYEFATSFERNHPTIIQMAEAIGVSDRLDEVFILAATL